MRKMVLTFGWDTDIEDGRIADEREFAVKDEKDIKKDITAWVKEMLKADKGKHKTFEVSRRQGCYSDWIVYGTKGRFNWKPNFMASEELIMVCTMDYFGYDRNMEADERAGKGYTFTTRKGHVLKFKGLVELDEFIMEVIKARGLLGLKGA